MARGPFVSPDMIADVQRLLSPGRAHRDIAEYVGVHRTVVSRIARGVQRARVVCDCGECTLCRNRVACAEYRRRKKPLLSRPASGNLI